MNVWENPAGNLLLAGFAAFGITVLGRFFWGLLLAPAQLWNELDSRVRLLEDQAISRLEISDPFEQTNPQGVHGNAERTWHIRIVNTGGIPLTNCRVEKNSFINRHREESKSLGSLFAEPFILNPLAERVVRIATFNERDSSPSARVFMGYVDTLNAIVRHAFPHELTIQVSASETVPVRRTYRIQIDERGFLCCDLVQRP